MITHKEPHFIFNQIKKGLNRVNDFISPNSVRLRQEQIEMLIEWQTMRWGLLYHDSSDLQYDNSTNLFASELESNRHYLRHNGFDLSDYKQELLQFIVNLLEPLNILVKEILIVLEQEIEVSSGQTPIQPDGFSTVTDNIEYEEHDSLKYENYLKQYRTWQHTHIEALDYQSKLISLDADIKIIEQTIRKDFFKIDNQPSDQIKISINPSRAKADSFESLFINPEDIKVCIDALRLIDPPLINSQGEWIDNKRGKKSMLVAWWDVVKQQGYVRSPDRDVELAKMLNGFIQGLRLEIKDAGIFRQNTTVRSDYQVDFLALIPRRKLTKLRR